MRVGFFVTCLVDLMRPSIGFAAIRLLEAGGAEVFVPPAQTCCGQPAYNSGDRADTRALAAKLMEEVDTFAAEFKGFEKVKKITVCAEDFTTENGLLTPSMKLKRRVAMQRFGEKIEKLYAEGGKEKSASAA